MIYPDWVLKQKMKGTLVMKRKDKYYLYRVSSHWDSDKKRAQMKTGEYLGRITPEGIIEPKAKMAMKRYSQVSVKEYGSSFLLYSISGDIIAYLSDNFPEWKEIFIFASMRLMHVSPMKNVEFYYSTSFLSELIKDAHVSPESLGSIVRAIGMDRHAQVNFMKNFMKDNHYLAVDLTHVLSMGDNIISATLGRNSMEEYLPQVQLLFLLSLDNSMPSYFRVLPGSINSVMSLKRSIEESGASHIVMVADTGFYSLKNLKELDKLGISYVIPLRRNSRLIDYSMEDEKYFMFQDHPVFFSRYAMKGTSRTMFTFRTDFLKAEEEKDYLRGHEGSNDKFRRSRERMGTISVVTDLHVSGEIVYDMLKSRVDIEQSYDTFKNTIYGDRTYMRDDYQLNGWVFVNFISLILYYRIYNLLMEHDALKKYSPKDVIEHLERVNMLKIGDEWKISEIPKKTRILIEQLDIHIMQNGGS